MEETNETRRWTVEPMPENIRSIQPGGGWIVAVELAFGRFRRSVLRTLFPGYVRRAKGTLRGDPSGLPIEIIDSRDLKFYRNQTLCTVDPKDDPFAWRGQLGFARAGYAEMLFFGAVPGGVGVALLFAPVPWYASLPFFAFAGFVVSFFRDPQRAVPQDPGVVVSPADGVVTDVTEVSADAFLGEPTIRISIFLSVFNVHVNRAPIAGRLLRLRYFPGDFLDARNPASAERNERMELYFESLEHPGTGFIVRQIAGLIARRIVCEAQTGQELRRGERFGMIKFGSRTDLLLPKRGLTVQVKPGDVVRGGATPMARQGFE